MTGFRTAIARTGARRARVLPVVLFLAGGLCLGSLHAQTAKVETLSDEQAARLWNVAFTQGSNIAVPAALAEALHLSPAQIAPSIRQVTVQFDDGAKHGFARLNDETGYFLFRRGTDGVTAYRLDKEFKLVVAAHNFGDERFIPLPEGTARDGVSAEIAGWLKVLSLPRPRIPLPGQAVPAAPPPPPSAPPGPVKP
jgi:hypothetical protein